MNLYDRGTHLALCAALDCSSFELHSHNATRNAQANLKGRSYYCDADTLRFHHARITATSVCVAGAFFRITETTALDFHNRERGCRQVLFDLTGEVIYCPSLDDCSRTSRQAAKAFDRWWSTFDPVHHYAVQLHAQAARARTQAETLLALAQQYSAALQVAA